MADLTDTKTAEEVKTEKNRKLIRTIVIAVLIAGVVYMIYRFVKK